MLKVSIRGLFFDLLICKYLRLRYYLRNIKPQLGGVMLEGMERKVNGDDVVFIVDDLTSSTKVYTVEEMEEMGLSYSIKGGEMYPLSDEEANLVARSRSDIGGFPFLMAYAVTYKGKKYLSPVVDIDFGPGLLTKDQAEKENLKLLEVVKRLAQKTGGYYCWHETPAVEFRDGDGTFCTEVMIPAEYAINNAANFNDWVSHLQTLSRETEEEAVT